jgi:hypothetical protein
MARAGITNKMPPNSNALCAVGSFTAIRLIWVLDQGILE